MRWAIKILLLFTFSSVSIAEQPQQISEETYRDLLLDGHPILGSLPEKETNEEIQLFALSDEMRDYLNRVALGKGPVRRLRTVISDMKQSGFKLHYDLNSTTSAAVAFSERRGNCVSFAAMIVTMARALGVEARLNIAPTPGRPKKARSKSGRGYVQNIRHINAVIMSNGKPYIIDQGFRISRGKYLTPLNDDEAYAIYLNNLAMEAMARNEIEQALEYSRESIRWNREASYLWNSLGTLYRRSGAWRLAEMSFSYALTLNEQDEMARSNLRLLQRLLQRKENSVGDTAKSAVVAASPELS